jgi:hypothetical protein
MISEVEMPQPGHVAHHQHVGVEVDHSPVLLRQQFGEEPPSVDVAIEVQHEVMAGER